MAVQLTRQEVVSRVHSAMEPLPFVLAMWEAGSAAWNRADEFSDIDLQLLVEDPHVEPALAACEKALAGLSPIELRFEVPKPTWHGHDQIFYRLRDAGEFMLVDLAVIKRSSENQFRERERHGERNVFFDKIGIAETVGLNPVGHAKYLDAYLTRLRAAFPMFQSLTKKELLRGNEVAALTFYFSHTLQPLLTLMRIRYCPHRFDFGPKYAIVDLPNAEYEDVKELYFVGSASELRHKRERAERLFWQNLEIIDSARQNRELGTATDSKG